MRCRKQHGHASASHGTRATDEEGVRCMAHLCFICVSFVAGNGRSNMVTQA